MDEKERREFCQIVNKQITDEAEATSIYQDMQDRAEASDNPTVRAIGWSGIEQIKKDERKHREVLEHIQRAVCATKM